MITLILLKLDPAFMQAEVDSMLAHEARLSDLPEWKRHVVCFSTK